MVPIYFLCFLHFIEYSGHDKSPWLSVTSHQERKQLQKEDRGTWYQERPMLGPNRPERGKTNSW